MGCGISSDTGTDVLGNNVTQNGRASLLHPDTALESRKGNIRSCPRIYQSNAKRRTRYNLCALSFFLFLRVSSSFQPGSLPVNRKTTDFLSPHAAILVQLLHPFVPSCICARGTQSYIIEWNHQVRQRVYHHDDVSLLTKFTTVSDSLVNMSFAKTTTTTTNAMMLAIEYLFSQTLPLLLLKHSFLTCTKLAQRPV